LGPQLNGTAYDAQLSDFDFLFLASEGVLIISNAATARISSPAIRLFDMGHLPFDDRDLALGGFGVAGRPLPTLNRGRGSNATLEIQDQFVAGSASKKFASGSSPSCTWSLKRLERLDDWIFSRVFAKSDIRPTSGESVKRIAGETLREFDYAEDNSG